MLDAVALLAALVTVVLLWVPGLALAATAGLRGWLLIGAAPAVTMSLVGIAAPLFPLVGVQWNLWTFIVWCVVITGVMGVVVLLLRRRGRELTFPQGPWSTSGHLTVVVSVVVAACVAVLVLRAATHGLATVPQGWDAPFHGNAIRLIAETGNSSPRALAWIDAPDNPGGSFYPNAYHCFEALVYNVSGADIPRILNTGMLVTTTLTIPLGTIALVRAFGGAAGFAAASALVSTSFAYYPWDLYQWGQLFPYAAALAMVLPFFAVLVRWLDTRADRLGVLVAFLGAGLTATHSASVFVAAGLGVFLVLQRLLADPREWVRRELPRLAVVAVAILVLASAYLLGASSMAGATAAYNWPAVTTVSRAFGDAVLFGSDAPWPQWLLALCTLAGLLLLWRDGTWRWMVAGYALFLGLLVAAAGLDAPWVQTITSPWWNDRFRLAAVIILPATLAAGWTLQTAARWVTEKVLQRVPETTRSRRTAIAVLAVVAMVLAGGYFGQSHGYAARNADRMTWTFDSPVLTPLEHQGLLETGKIVKDGELHHERPRRRHRVVVRDLGAASGDRPLPGQRGHAEARAAAEQVQPLRQGPAGRRGHPLAQREVRDGRLGHDRGVQARGGPAEAGPGRRAHPRLPQPGVPAVPHRLGRARQVIC
ncbi:DUF6541 family protein [Lentzea chajnantorensis]